MELALPGESRIAVSDSDVREALACMRDPCSEYDDIQPVVGYDIETGGLRPMYDPLCLAQLSNAKLAVAIPYKDISPAAQGMFLDFLRDDSSRPPLVAHNSNFEWRFSAAAGAEITGGLLDTMVLEQVLTAGLKAEVGLEDTVARRLHLEMPKAQQSDLRGVEPPRRDSVDPGVLPHLFGVFAVVRHPIGGLLRLGHLKVQSARHRFLEADLRFEPCGQHLLEHPCPAGHQ